MIKRVAALLTCFGLATVVACGSDAVVADDDDDDDSPSAKDSGTTTRRDAGPKDASAPGKDGSTKKDSSTPDEDAGPADDGGSLTDGGSTDGGGITDGGSTDGGGITDGSTPAPKVVWLNEILADPPGTDSNNEFVELGCKPGQSLSSYYFVIVEGDYNGAAPTSRGTVSFSKALTDVTCGSGGLVVLQRGGVYSGVAGTVYANNFFGGAAAGAIENGSQSYWLSSASVGDVGTDLDANDDGVVDDAAIVANLVDSMGFNDGYAQDLVYSPAVLLGTDTTAAFSRFAATTATATADWYFGDVEGPSPWSYAANVSANFPAGGTLSPGAQNSAKP